LPHFAPLHSQWQNINLELQKIIQNPNNIKNKLLIMRYKQKTSFLNLKIMKKSFFSILFFVLFFVSWTADAVTPPVESNLCWSNTYWEEFTILDSNNQDLCDKSGVNFFLNSLSKDPFINQSWDWEWQCAFTIFETTTHTCNAIKPPEVLCWIAENTPTFFAPITWLCSDSSTPQVTENTDIFEWMCDSHPCSVEKKEVSCWTAINIPTYSEPTNWLCNDLSHPSVTEKTDTFEWTCDNTTCSVGKKIDWVCWTTQEYTCNPWAFSSENDIGSEYTWTCNGINWWRNDDTCRMIKPNYCWDAALWEFVELDRNHEWLCPEWSQVWGLTPSDSLWQWNCIDINDIQHSCSAIKVPNLCSPLADNTTPLPFDSPSLDFLGPWNSLIYCEMWASLINHTPYDWWGTLNWQCYNWQYTLDCDADVALEPECWEAIQNKTYEIPTENLCINLASEIDVIENETTYNWDCGNNSCTSLRKIDWKCSVIEDQCDKWESFQLGDSETQIKWACYGLNWWRNNECFIDKPAICWINDIEILPWTQKSWREFSFCELWEAISCWIGQNDEVEIPGFACDNSEVFLQESPSFPLSWGTANWFCKNWSWTIAPCSIERDLAPFIEEKPTSETMCYNEETLLCMASNTEYWLWIKNIYSDFWAKCVDIWWYNKWLEQYKNSRTNPELRDQLREKIINDDFLKNWNIHWDQCWFFPTCLNSTLYDYLTESHSISWEFSQEDYLENHYSWGNTLEWEEWIEYTAEWKTIKELKDNRVLFLSYLKEVKRILIEIESMSNFMNTCDKWWIWYITDCAKNLWKKLDNNWIYCSFKEFKKDSLQVKNNLTDIQNLINVALLETIGGVWEPKEETCEPWLWWDWTICSPCECWLWNNWSYLECQDTEAWYYTQHNNWYRIGQEECWVWTYSLWMCHWDNGTNECNQIPACNEIVYDTWKRVNISPCWPWEYQDETWAESCKPILKRFYSSEFNGWPFVTTWGCNASLCKIDEYCLWWIVAPRACVTYRWTNFLPGQDEAIDCKADAWYYWTGDNSNPAIAESSYYSLHYNNQRSQCIKPQNWILNTNFVWATQEWATQEFDIYWGCLAIAKTWYTIVWQTIVNEWSVEIVIETVSCWWVVANNATATTWWTYTQTWDWSNWIPVLNWEQNQTKCDFDCNTNYTWNNPICEADTRENQACTWLLTNTQWNNVNNIDQTWNW